MTTLSSAQIADTVHTPEDARATIAALREKFHMIGFDFGPDSVREILDRRMQNSRTLRFLGVDEDDVAQMLSDLRESIALVATQQEEFQDMDFGVQEASEEAVNDALGATLDFLSIDHDYTYVVELTTNIASVAGISPVIATHGPWCEAVEAHQFGKDLRSKTLADINGHMGGMAIVPGHSPETVITGHQIRVVFEPTGEDTVAVFVSQ